MDDLFAFIISALWADGVAIDERTAVIADRFPRDLKLEVGSAQSLSRFRSSSLWYRHFSFLLFGLDNYRLKGAPVNIRLDNVKRIMVLFRFY